VSPLANILDEPDEELAPLLAQVQNHLDSIKANTQQLAKVDEEMLRTRAALATFLPQHVT
jgi:cytolysin (calcineurin-like family phosphatase)